MKSIIYFLFSVLFLTACNSEEDPLIVDNNIITRDSTVIKSAKDKPLEMSCDLFYYLEGGGCNAMFPSTKIQYKVGSYMMFDPYNNKIINLETTLNINATLASNYYHQILSWNQSHWSQKPVANSNQITVSFSGSYSCSSGNITYLDLEYVYDPATNTSRPKRPKPVAMDAEVCY